MKRVNIKKNQGYLMPLALVIILVIGAFSIAIHQLVNRSSGLSLQQGLASQAYYAAESGAQYAMHQLYFNQLTRAQVDAQCLSVNGSTLNFTAPSLKLCSASISCARTVNTADTISVYTLNISGQCGSVGMVVQRELLVKGKME